MGINKDIHIAIVGAGTYNSSYMTYTTPPNMYH